MIKPLTKKKKKGSQRVSYWAKKADKVLQELQRELKADKGCLICGGEYSCQHHVVLKSQSTFLRYKEINLISVCAGCHLKFHNRNPIGVKEIMDNLIEIKDQDWYDELLALKRNNQYINAGCTYYRDIYNKLKI